MVGRETKPLDYRQTLLSGLLFAAFRFLFTLPICIMAVMALRAAQRRQQTPLVKWLVPLVIGHVLALVLTGYDLSVHVLYLGIHGRAVTVNPLMAYGFGVIQVFVALYTTVCILAYVRQYPLLQTPLPVEGVWPPPPTPRTDVYDR
jgi:hypothetical protein